MECVAEYWGIVCGGTDSILPLELPDDFEFVELSLDETVFCERIKDMNGMLNVRFMGSNLGEDNQPKFILLHKLERYNRATLNECEKHPIAVTDEYSLDNNKISEIRKKSHYIISFLRVFKEGNIEIPLDYICLSGGGENKVWSEMEGAMIICDDFYRLNEVEVNQCSFFLKKYFEYGSFIENVLVCFNKGCENNNIETAYKELTTMNEGLLIGYNSRDKDKNKKIKFANRIASVVSEPDEVKTTRNHLLSIYKERSTETHEIRFGIKKEDLIEYRDISRIVVKDFLDFLDKNYSSLENVLFDDVKKQYAKNAYLKAELLLKQGYLDTNTGNYNE